MNGISGISSSSMMQSLFSGYKRDSSQTMQNLFSELDTSGQGYLEKTDLQTAFNKVTSTTATSGQLEDESNIDELFSQLDTDGDGKVTKQEFTDSLARIDEQINSLFSAMRMNEAKGGMPPPPSDRNGENGFTAEELSAQLAEIGSNDNERSSLISNILENFDQADSNGDGKVSFEEAMAFDQGDTGTSASMNETTLQGADRMPPPPAPGGFGNMNESGLSKEELASLLSEIDSTESDLANQISNIIDNFDEADMNGDGRVSLRETMAFNQDEATQAVGSSSNETATASSSEETLNAKVMLQVLRLVQAYSANNETPQGNDSQLSVTV